MKRLLIILFVLICIPRVFAGCFRAGEITYSHISGLTYEIKLKLYVDSFCHNNDPVITSLGDTLSLIDITYLFDSSFMCKTYTGLHSFSGPGTYIISIELPNRPYGIINIPGSVNIPFFIESRIIVNPFVGVNHSPVFNSPAIVKGSINNVFTYNPMATDADGDSISYKLTACKGGDGMPILGYTYPMASNVFTLDSITGDIFWDSPYMPGDYNIAMIIEEWRQGTMIGHVTREIQMQIATVNSIIENNQEHKDISIFPNPAYQILNISLSDLKGNISYEISDFNCRIIKSGELRNYHNTAQIDVALLKPGMYIIRFMNGRFFISEKFLKY